MSPLVIFHVLPVPKRRVVQVLIAERGKRALVGDLEIPVRIWRRIEPCLRSCRAGFRVRVHPP